MKNTTTIKVDKKTRDKMKQKKIVKGETYNEVINRLIKISLVFFSFIFLISFSSALTYVDRCMDLTVAGEYYQQNASIVNNTITANKGCIDINAPNITFDGNGFTLNSTQATRASVLIRNESNLIKNIRATGFGGFSYGSVSFRGTGNNSIIKDSYLEQFTTQGIQLLVSNITIENVSFNRGSISVCFDCFGTGLAEYSTIKNSISSNSISAGGTGAGYLSIRGKNIRIYNVTLINHSLISAIAFNDANDTILENIYIYSNNSNLNITQARRSNRINFTNVIVDGAYNMFITDNSGGNISNFILLNATYNTSSESLQTGSQLYRKWYFNANATNNLTNLPIANVNVSGRDNTNALIFSVLTGSNGYIPTQELTEYVNNGGTRTYYSNYTINASYGTQSNVQSLNLTTNSFINFFLRKLKILPTISSLSAD